MIVVDCFCFYVNHAFLKAASHVSTQTQAKATFKCRPQTRIAVSQDGGNLIPRVRVTLDQQSRNEDSGNAIKNGRHLGLSLNHRGMERVFFILRLPLPLLCPGLHV